MYIAHCISSIYVHCTVARSCNQNLGVIPLFILDHFEDHLCKAIHSGLLDSSNFPQYCDSNIGLFSIEPNKVIFLPT